LDKHKAFVVSLAFLIVLTAVILAALNVWRIEVYVSLFAVCYFATSAQFKPRMRSFDFVGGGLFLVFCLIVTVKVLEILL
jgi:hypothetical protein